MPSHGDFDPDVEKWFCGYWMDEIEWKDVHDYRPEEKDTDDEAIDDVGDE